MSQDRGLVVTGISKSYGATHALADVSLAIPAGKVVALVGHNGAGKSTLLRTLSGAETPDAGTIRIDGLPVEFHRPAEANAAGIATVYQELSLVNELTVAENLFLGAEKLAGPMLDRRVMNAEADAVCAEYGILATATSRVADLSVAQRQLLEVARAIHRDARFLLLDEPTTALEQSQIDTLLDLIRRLAAERGIGILFIDHKLDEVFAIANHVVGLANGEVVLDGSADTVKREEVVEAIVGAGENAHAIGDAGARAARPERDLVGAPTVFEARDLHGNGLAGIDLKAHAGEVLGIYGLIGSGRSRFLRTIYGAEPLAEGQMLLDGTPYRPASPHEAIARDVAFLSEERKSDGFIPQMTSLDNVVLPVLGRFMSAGMLKWRALYHAAEGVLDHIPIRGDVRQPITALSGGNQQKALFARSMLQAPNSSCSTSRLKASISAPRRKSTPSSVTLPGRAGRCWWYRARKRNCSKSPTGSSSSAMGACDGEAVPEVDLSVRDPPARRLGARRMRLSASLHAADPLRLGEAVAAVAGAVETLHIDVMDGRFAPAFGFGEGLVRRLIADGSPPVDVHHDARGTG